LGTDLAGRDIFVRLLKGAPLTLGISVLSVSFALVVGTLLGLLAGFYRGYVQLLIMRTMDVIFAIPSLILAIVVVMILGKGLFNAGLAVALVLIPNFVRTTMTHVIDEMQKPYVAAARLDGAHPIRILLSSVFPNIAAPLTLQTTIALSTAVIDIALLGFLGLGAQPPLPEWGVMLSEARTSMHIAPWAVTIPGLAILITVICINFIGDGLNRVINHKLRH
ncbi:MAG: ABC transporter permease, partial [Enterobacterales bacterium]|nr:ABC transporter permease [Enterobacterales bacterium]